MAHVAWLMSHGSCRMAHVAWLMSHGSCRMAHVAWLMSHGSCRMAHVAWLMSQGSCRMAHVAWLMSHGSCRMAHVAWLMSHGSCRTAHVAWLMSRMAHVTHGSCRAWLMSQSRKKNIATAPSGTGDGRGGNDVESTPSLFSTKFDTVGGYFWTNAVSYVLRCWHVHDCIARDYQVEYGKAVHCTAVSK